MISIKDLIDIEFRLIKTTQAGNIFSGSGKTCLLKPVNRAYKGSIKKPLYYISAIESGISAYLSGLFSTSDPMLFSADYKDDLGIKHIVKIAFSDSGKSMKVMNS